MSGPEPSGSFPPCDPFIPSFWRPLVLSPVYTPVGETRIEAALGLREQRHYFGL
jgi:hypothetical protein